MDKNELLKRIRELIGNKTFLYPCEYRPKKPCTIGINNDVKYYSITRKYVYASCCAYWQHRENKEGVEEWGLVIRKLSLFKTENNKERVRLEDLYTDDLKRIYNHLTAYYTWLSLVRLPKIQAQYDEVSSACKRFEKFSNKYFKHET